MAPGRSAPWASSPGSGGPRRSPRSGPWPGALASRRPSGSGPGSGRGRLAARAILSLIHI
eukprot:4237301-Alexandrium_andersonii.AAC.1